MSNKSPSKASPKSDKAVNKKLSANEDPDPEPAVASEEEETAAASLPTAAVASKRARVGQDGKAVATANDDDSNNFTPEELAKMTRSERKRHREKKRRSDVNKGFDELMTLLLEIDPVVRAEAEDRARRGQWKGEM